MENEKEFDIAQGTFLEEWHPFLRWILFLPAAFLGCLAASWLFGVVQGLSMAWIGATKDGLWYFFILLAQSYILGITFVLFGATVAPKGQFIVSILLLVFGTIFSVIVYLGNYITLTAAPWEMLIHSLLVIAGAVTAVYLVHKGEPIYG